MTTSLTEIRAREAAAIKGPWRFDINLKGRHISLVALISGYEFVMGGRRWGMGGATFEFQKHDQCLMYKAEEFAVPIKGREHHADWCQTLDHPDANFIAHSREDIPYLLAEVDRLRAALKKIAHHPCYREHSTPGYDCTSKNMPCEPCIASMALDGGDKG